MQQTYYNTKQGSIFATSQFWLKLVLQKKNANHGSDSVTFSMGLEHATHSAYCKLWSGLPDRPRSTRAGPLSRRCYRDTKMEIQGLSDAQNIHSQHGARHRIITSPLHSAAGSIPRFISTENGGETRPDSLSLQSDDNNNKRPRTSPFHLQAENGSEALRLPVSLRQPANKTAAPANNWPAVGLCHVALELETVNERDEFRGGQETVSNALKYVTSGGDSALQMALPSLFEGEEELTAQRHLTLPLPVLRQQREDGTSVLPCQDSSSSHDGATTRAGSYCAATRGAEKATEGDGTGGTTDLQPDVSFEDGDKMRESKPASPESSPSCSMEVASGGDGTILCESNNNSNPLDPQTSTRTEHVFALESDNSSVASASQTAYHRAVEDVVLTNKYGEKICGQICTENRESKLVAELAPQASVDDSVARNSAVVEDMDTSDFISNPATASTSPPAGETFSGTITINNQSIIVTMENGVLTLAAPPEGYTHKEDDMISLREHLGMKEHEDIVLLNYDSGTKSIGKISTVAVSAAAQQEEPRAGLSVSDSELALVDDCSLSELGTSLDSCPIVKQETGILCTVSEADLVVTPQPKASCESGVELQSSPIVRSKKELVAASFGCPEPGCQGVFDTRQKLKVHLLNHAEDPRPYQCTIEGCGWAFATSYKLKRHLQSHDKQRPHICQFEGCGRCFTTVYNLKAHVKVHEQDNAFICEICSERFRSATRLTNHQRVHFEPERPHKCEFPGITRPCGSNCSLTLFQ